MAGTSSCPRPEVVAHQQEHPQGPPLAVCFSLARSGVLGSCKASSPRLIMTAYGTFVLAEGVVRH